MRYLSLAVITSLLLFACTNKNENEQVKAPAAPATIADVTNGIKGKKFSAEKLGILSKFKMDSANPVNWNMHKEDTSKFYRDYEKAQLAYSITFGKDSTCSFYDTDGKKTINATWAVDNNPELGYEEEIPGVKLRVKYADSTMDLSGARTAATLTLSYLVRGLSDNVLVVETGRSYNDHKVILWMKKD